jgi:hypothetical protein
MLSHPILRNKYAPATLLARLQRKHGAKGSALVCFFILFRLLFVLHVCVGLRRALRTHPKKCALPIIQRSPTCFLKALFRGVLSKIEHIFEWNIDREGCTFNKYDVKLRLPVLCDNDDGIIQLIRREQLLPDSKFQIGCLIINNSNWLILDPAAGTDRKTSTVQ